MGFFLEPTARVVLDRDFLALFVPGIFLNDIVLELQCNTYT